MRDILAAVNAIAAYTEGMTYEEFVADARTGERRGPQPDDHGRVGALDPRRDPGAHRAVPWRLMRGVRNVVVHEYFGVDDAILWQTVRGDLPPLAPLLEDVLAS